MRATASEPMTAAKAALGALPAAGLRGALGLASLGALAAAFLAAGVFLPGMVLPAALAKARVVGAPPFFGYLLGSKAKLTLPASAS